MEACIAQSISQRTAYLLRSLEHLQLPSADFTERLKDYGTFTTSSSIQSFKKSKSETETDAPKSQQNRTSVGRSGEKIPRVMTRPPPMVMAKIPEGKPANTSATATTSKSKSLSSANEAKTFSNNNSSSSGKVASSSNHYPRMALPPQEGSDHRCSTDSNFGSRPGRVPLYDTLYTPKWYQPTGCMFTTSAIEPVVKTISCNNLTYPRHCGLESGGVRGADNSCNTMSSWGQDYAPFVHRIPNAWTGNSTPSTGTSDKFGGKHNSVSQFGDISHNRRPKPPASEEKQKSEVTTQNKQNNNRSVAKPHDGISSKKQRPVQSARGERLGQQPVVKKSGKKHPDLNNNFFKEPGATFFAFRVQGPKEDEMISGPDRINKLAQPKRYPCPHRQCGDGKRLTPEAMQRIENLAQPKLCHYTVCSCCMSPNCLGECTTKFRPRESTSRDAADVDWDRLATPRKVKEQDFRPIRTVQSAALRASTNDRIEKLSVPRKQINSGDYYVWLWRKKPDTHVHLKPIRRLSIYHCDLKDARVLLRCDLDFTKGKPIDEKVRDTVPTMQLALKKEAKSVVIVSKCGPEGIPKDPKYSLGPLAGVLEKYLETRVIFLDDCVGFQAQALCEDPVPGSVFLLENLSFTPEEVGYVMNNDEKVLCKKEDVQRYRKILSDHGDVYITDSFCELQHMTNTTLGYKPKPFGFGAYIKKELSIFQKFAVTPAVQVLAIVSGRFETTWTIVRSLMGKCQNILVGGHMAAIILRAIKDIEIGVTKCTPKMIKQALKLFSRAKDTGTTLHLPSDFVVKHVDTNEYFVALSRGDIDKWLEIVDIGPHTRQCFTEAMKVASAILWLGDFGPLTDGTEAIKEVYLEVAKKGTPTYAADNIVKNVIGGVISKPDECLFLTGDGEITEMLLRGQMPKGLAHMSRTGKKVKLHAAPVEKSKKPSAYELPGMAIVGGAKAGESYGVSNHIMCINHVDIEDKKVLIRVEFNEPLVDNVVTNNYRMRMSIPTIKYALKWRARAVIILAHFAKPKGRRDSSLSLKPICDELASLLGETVIFVPRTIGRDVLTTISMAHPGSVFMLENVGFHQEEEQGFMTLPDGCLRPMDRMLNPAPYLPSGYTAELNAQFCEDLTRLGDIYVNDAFGALHLNHSSITGNFRPVRVCGFLVKNELKYLAKLLNYPARRFLMILGGSNYEDKIDLLPGIFREVDSLILAGTLACLFLKVEHSLKTGNLNFSQKLQNRARELVKLAAYYKCRLHFPVDLTVATDGGKGELKQVSVSEGIPDGYTFVDIGNLSAPMFTRIIKRKQMIFWSGVTGNGSLDYKKSKTRLLLEAVYSVTHDPEKSALTIIGGRSMSQVVDKHDPEHEAFTHLTTGGRTALELLAYRHVVGLDALLPKPGKRPMALLGCEDFTEFREAVVALKCDLDIPMDDGVPLNDFPLKHVVDTIRFLQRKGAAAIILVSRRGYPDGQNDENLSLEVVQPVLESALGQTVQWKPHALSPGVDNPATGLPKGSVVLTENIGFKPAEAGFMTTEAGDRVPVSHDELSRFRNHLSYLADVFVNESFATIHRTYSSVVGLSKKSHIAGPSLKKQVYDYVDIRRNVEGNFLLILGAENVEDIFPNLLLLIKALDIVDSVFFCGMMSAVFQSSGANSSIKEYQNAQLLIPRINHMIKLKKVTVTHITDALATRDPSDPDEEPRHINLDSWMPRGYSRCDMGPASSANLITAIKEAKLILLVGPTDSLKYEHHNRGTKSILDQIAAVTSDGSAISVALGMRTGQFIHHFGHADSFTSFSVAAEPFFDILLRRPLAGLQVLNRLPANFLKKLSMEQMDLAGKRVLLRLDLDVPSVEGVVLDTDKLEDAAPTIMYALNQGAKSVVLLGHRGEPLGYKNYYLRMEPLVVELSAILALDVNFIDRPCSKKARRLLEDPPAGSVFLMENLKFYPAELGQDAEPRKTRGKPEDSSMTGVSEISKDETLTEEITGTEGQDMDEGANGSPEEAEEDESLSYEDMSVSDGEGGISVDSLMYQSMQPKTVKQFVRDLAACGDVFINDDVAHLEETLTSFEGFDLVDRGCGLLLAEFLRDSEESGVYMLPGVENLSPAP